MKKLLQTNTFLGILFLLCCITACKTNKETPLISTNPSDCKLAKVYFGNKSFNEYDAPTYNTDGTVAKLESYSSGEIFLTTTFTYANGLLINQKNKRLEVKYTYTNNDLSNAELIDNSGTKIGDLAIVLNANKQIASITVKNPNATYALFTNAVSTYTYDANGNNTLIQIKDANANLVSTISYSDFVAVKSHFTTFKGLVFDAFTSPIDFLQFPPILKYSNYTPTKFKKSTILDDNLMPTATMTLVAEDEFQRIPNESGLQIERKTTKSFSGSTGSNYYEYTGCK